MKRYIKSDDHAISMTARMWHYGEDWEKAETTFSSIVHMRVKLVTKCSSSCSVQHNTNTH